jgi:nitrite reductase/ring-hydroxylating ferredoxin subunit
MRLAPGAGRRATTLASKSTGSKSFAKVPSDHFFFNGAIRAVDAVCPHLGAHLGAGGKVVGNTLKCPFHGWRFDGTGACVAIPYAARIPPKARVRSWDVREQNGQILVWYHADRAEPSFEVPHLDGFGDQGWTRPTFHTVTVRTHVQEMNENIFDVAHFVEVHHFRALPTADIHIDGPHVEVRLDGIAALPGRPVAKAQTQNIMHGAGFTAIRARSEVRMGPVNLPIEILVVVGKTPIDDQHVEHRYAIMFRKIGPLWGRLLFPIVRRQTIADVHHDAEIWENKQHLVKPILVKPEGAIAKFRKWHQQFYADGGSPEPALAEA